MKTNFGILALLCVLPSILCAQEENRFRLEGKVDTQYNDYLVTLFTFVGNQIRTVDSTYVDKGCFRFEGSEYLYEESVLSLGNYPDTVLSTGVYLCKGDIKVELTSKPVVHSWIMDEYKAFRDSSQRLFTNMYAWNETERNNVSDEEWKKRHAAYWQFRYDFKKKHLSDALGRKLFIEDTAFDEEPYSGRLYKQMSERDQNRADIQETYGFWKRRNAWEQMKGKPFPDFALTDSTGQVRRLSDFAGQYEWLYLDFWASWCGPCRAVEPKLKRMIEQYGGKGFGIIAISLDQNRKSWLSLLRKEKRPWLDLCIASPADDEKIRELYKIAGIPHGVLINGSGEIYSILSPHQLPYFLKELSKTASVVKP